MKITMSPLRSLTHFYVERLSTTMLDEELSVILGFDDLISEVTLRSVDLDTALAFDRNRLGMRHSSMQPVKDYCFALNLLALNDECRSLMGMASPEVPDPTGSPATPWYDHGVQVIRR